MRAGPRACSLAAAATTAVVVALTGAPAAAEGAGPVTVRNYDLGAIAIEDGGALGPLPVRLRGAVAVPATRGPRPLVIVAHGRHGDGCPLEDDFPTWPCEATAQRNDLGLRHAVAALGRRGVVAIAPDLNGAYTAGWGEPNDRARWPRIVERTIRELVAAATVGDDRFGIDLDGGIDLRRLGVLGHSLSGLHATRLVRRRAANTAPQQVAAGRGPVRAAFLLAPVAPGGRLPGVHAALGLASCDGDTGAEGRRYLRRAARTPDRSKPVFLVELLGANHNYFNRTLVRLGRDDAVRAGPECRPRRRLGGAQQMRWLDRAAGAFFARTLLGAPRPRWMRRGGRPPARVHGRRARVERFVP